MRVLFLDFDGVVHPGPEPGGIRADSPLILVAHFGWLAHLADVLRPHPDVAIAVHSTWRYLYDDDELRELLDELGSRYVGRTPRGPRHESILWWLNANPGFTEFRVLDDDVAEFPTPVPEELIVCDPRRGLSAPEVLEALRAWLDETSP